MCCILGLSIDSGDLHAMAPTLHFMCGKMAAGKSTLAKKLAEQHGAILICEDL